MGLPQVVQEGARAAQEEEKRAQAEESLAAAQADFAKQCAARDAKSQVPQWDLNPRWLPPVGSKPTLATIL